MKRIPVSLTEAQHAELSRISREDGDSIATHIRSAIDHYLTQRRLTMKSRRDMDIEQVASLIAEGNWAYDFDSAEQFATTTNAGEGWSFEVRYGTEARGNYTRVEGLQLSTTDLTRALELAAAWSRGEKHVTARDLR